MLRLISLLLIVKVYRDNKDPKIPILDSFKNSNLLGRGLDSIVS